MITLPFPILLKLWHSAYEKGKGTAKFTHESILATLPPGVSITVAIIPTVVDRIQYHFCMTFGDLVDANVVIIHEHPRMMKKHEDPLIYSIVSQPYPLNLRVTTDLPHIVTIQNNGTVSRDVEVTFWMVETEKDADYDIEKLFDGLTNLITAFSQLTPDQIATWIKGE